MYTKSHREMTCTQHCISLWIRYITSKPKLNLIFWIWNFFPSFHICFHRYHIIYAFSESIFSCFLFIHDWNIIEISIISICNSHSNRYQIWNTLFFCKKKFVFFFVFLVFRECFYAKENTFNIQFSSYNLLLSHVCWNFEWNNLRINIYRESENNVRVNNPLN